MTRYYDRCTDCGEHTGERKISKHLSICDACWQRREWIVERMNQIETERFKKLQRSMAYHTGTAKRQIIKLQKEWNFPTKGEGGE